MANLDFTLKRKTSTGYDVLLPTTTVEQIYRTSDSESLTNILAAKADAATHGYAPLDSSGKILVSDLPTEILGGLKFVSTIGNNIDGYFDLTTISQNLSAENVGRFWISAGTTKLSNEYWFMSNVTAEDISLIQPPGDEGDFTFQSAGGYVEIEPGDWVVLINIDNGSGKAVFAIVDNDYTYASSSVYGLTKLSSVTNVDTATGNNVITDGILSGLMGTADGKIARGDHLHNGTYLRLTGLDTMTGDLMLDKDGTADVGSHGIVFKGNILTADFNKELNMTSGGVLTFDGYKVWHEGNDGASNGLDADLLDGQHGSYYLNYNNFTNKPTSLSNFTDDVVAGNYVQITGDTMTGNLTLDAISPTASDSHSHDITFTARAINTTFTKNLKLTDTGKLFFDNKEVYYAFNTSTGKLLYNTTTSSNEGDFIVDLD